MAVGAQVAQAKPASILAAFLRAEVLRGVNDTRAPVGSRHGIRPSGWSRCGMEGLMVTGRARRTLRETRKGCGLVRTLPWKPGGYGCRWRLRGASTAARPDRVQHEA